MDEGKAANMVERAYDQKGYIGKEVQQRAQAQGYDGLMQYRNGDLSEVVTYKPGQVKSAIGNRGTYDMTDPDLNKAGGGLMKALKSLKGPKESVKRNIEVRPPSDNVSQVRQANFQYPKTVGNQTVAIDKLVGGVRLSDPNEAKRVKELADKIASPQGYISRIIVDHNNNVIEGQHRLEALRQLGISDVPVYKIEDLSDTMPVSAMESALSSVGPIHPDHVSQLVGQALENIAEHGVVGARDFDYGRYQKHYDAALDAAQSVGSDLNKAGGGDVHMDKGGAAFGVFPQMKPRRSKQDREAAKNVPVDLARGFVSGVLGAPGDIESFVRLPYELITGNESPTFLPTSEDIEKRLPFRSEAPVSRAATGLGQIGGGFYLGPGSPLRAVGALPGAIKHGAQEFAKASAAGAPRVIKPKGGNFLTGSVEKALEPLKTRLAEAADQNIGFGQGMSFRELREQDALNQWVDRNLANYVKKEMATPEDPVRKLAEQGISHLPEDELRRAEWLSEHMENVRRGEGFPSSGMAQSDMGRSWENLADEAIAITAPRVANEEMMAANPWLSKLDPDQSVYRARPSDVNDLGFDHIMDVLREDVASGRIRPEQLSKVSMEQAVRRTYDYDQELAAKMTASRAAQREGLPVYKEYPEGYRWVELNKPGSFTSESEAMGHSVRGYEPPKGHPDWTEGSGDSGSLGYGHGGWEAIKEGKAKVYSLVDPKGAPHATVEVGQPYKDRGFFGDQRPKGDDYYIQQNKYIAGQKNGTVSPKLTFAEWWRASQGIPEPQPLAPQITQIKGKQNRAPKEEYLPFVQDFVRSGNWSGVGDLPNTGMFKIESGPRATEFDKAAFERYGNYATTQELDELEKILKAQPPEGMKAGGPVKMAGGGTAKKVVEGAVKGVKKLFGAADEAPKGALPTAERDANLNKMLEGSKVKERLYHGTTDDVQKFDPTKSGKKTGNLTTALGTFLSDNPTEASRYAEQWGTKGGNVMPVFAQVKNPYQMPYKEFDNLAMGAWNRRMKDPDYDPNAVIRFSDTTGQKRASEALKKHENDARQDVIKRRDELMSMGHDGVIVNIGGNREIIVFDPSKIKSATGNRGTYDITDPDINKAAGGAIHMAGGGAMKEVLKKLLKPGADTAAQEVTAAERAAAGRKAAELIKSQPPVKASEALGQAMEKGFKKTTTTQADRTRVGGGNIGGAPFSAISEVDPAYAGKVWGVMDEGTAARLKNLTDPETAWTTMLGSANQLKTNPIVFEKLKKGFLESMKAGNLNPELEAKINHNLALTFGDGASIRDPGIWKQADTFEKRAALADLMMGQGIAPGKGGVALGGEKSGKGVIFKPTDILKRETEPGLLHPEHGGSAPTFAAGPRLFKMDPMSEYRPDLHPGFPTLISGKDLGVNMIPTPTEVYLPEWHSRFKKANPNRKGPGYYDLALGVKGEGLPSQDLNDPYIRHLIREGFKAGGTVSGLSTVNKLCGCHD